MLPSDIYQSKINEAEVRYNPQQAQVLSVLDAIAREINRKQHSLWLRWFQRPIHGLYLWGNVGIGKTFLIDCFFQAITVPKRRIHFHQFMRSVHETLASFQGIKNPLDAIAKSWSEEVSVICFDEFFVNDIADAMLLAQLLRALTAHRVTFLISSNIPPDLLYKEGLQRERFLPAIALIKRTMTVMHLHHLEDYRRARIEQAGVFFTPNDAAAEQEMRDCFSHFSNHAPVSNECILINHRPIDVVQSAGKLVWFTFDAICGRPRSQMDYLALINIFHTFFVSGVRRIDPGEKDLILSLIFLVDILYDAHARLIMSSDVAITEIYPAGPYHAPFQRTLSRLIEMQSATYFYAENIENHLTEL